MSPALDGSSALQRFERSNAIEIRNGIMFDFYPGLPHVLAQYSIAQQKSETTTQQLVLYCPDLHALSFC